MLTLCELSSPTPDARLCRRAAARCNKGVEVLLAVALEHFVLVVVRVLRGPTQADESAKKLRKLVHCQWCEERVFLKQGNMVDGESYRRRGMLCRRCVNHEFNKTGNVR